MNFTMLLATFFFQTPAAPPNPSAEPLIQAARYEACLLERASYRLSTRLPQPLAERQEVVAGILEQCHEVREHSAQTAVAAFAREPGFSDPANRNAAVELFFRGFEDRIRFMIVENERFAAER